MGSGEKLSYEGLTKEQLARFFREIADKVEGISEVAVGQTPVTEEQTALTGEQPSLAKEYLFLVPEDFQKLEVGVKKEAEGFSLKIKIKSLYEEGEKEESESKGKNRYKKIKKRMKAGFKEISGSLNNDSLPGEEIVASFFQDSRLMTSFSEYGAEFFPEYDKACAEFRKAFENKDLESCKVAYQELNRLKKDCHKRYKE